MPRVNCCVPLCTAESKGSPDLHFYPLPKKGTRERQTWIRLIRNKNLRTEFQWTSVCSLHFVNGRKTYDDSCPTIFPWSQDCEKVICTYNNTSDPARPKFRSLKMVQPQSHRKRQKTGEDGSTAREKRMRKRLFDTQANISTLNVERTSYTVSLDESTIADENHLMLETVGQPNAQEKACKNQKDSTVIVKDELQQLLQSILNKLSSQDSDPDPNSIRELQALLIVVTKLLMNVKEKLDCVVELRHYGIFFLKRFEGNDSDIRFLDRIYSYQALMTFYHNMLEQEAKCLQYWGANNSTTKDGDSLKCGRKRTLIPMDEMFMTLVKLRQGSANLDLAERFGINEIHVSRIFITWVNFMHSVLCSLDIWMSRGKIRRNSPNIFKEIYQDVRIIIDCPEISLERPSDFEVQAATYSTYKSCNTLKGLIGISPNGIPTFVSALFKGSISDNQIIFDSGLVEKLQEGDAIMADRGSTGRESLAKHKIRLVTPHFLSNKDQMQIQNLVESVSIARVRIHVERLMGRLKQWVILSSKVPITFWKHINHIFQLCVMLVLFWPPLLDKDSE